MFIQRCSPTVLTLAGMIAVGASACSRHTPTASEAGTTAGTTAVPLPAVEKRSPIQEAQEARTLTAALSVAKPEMDDAPNELGDGTIMLLAWAAKSMHWSDVGVPADETSYALVMKDPEEERGKRICVSGAIIQIEVEKTDFGKFHSGLLMSHGGNIFRFLGVGSSGTLVEKNRARFCGVVTGRYDYSNSGGGTGHAVKFVGMFDLPANRAAGATTR